MLRAQHDEQELSNAAPLAMAGSLSRSTPCRTKSFTWGASLLAGNGDLSTSRVDLDILDVRQPERLVSSAIRSRVVVFVVIDGERRPAGHPIFCSIQSKEQTSSVVDARTDSEASDRQFTVRQRKLW